jgi:hypothetical protein
VLEPYSPFLHKTFSRQSCCYNENDFLKRRNLVAKFSWVGTSWSHFTARLCEPEYEVSSDLGWPRKMLSHSEHRRRPGREWAYRRLQIPWNKIKIRWSVLHFILFCFVYFILFCFILFYFILFCFILFYFILFYFILFYTQVFRLHFISFHFILFFCFFCFFNIITAF